MKLKLKKRKIASLRITHQLLGGNTTDGGGDPDTSDVSDGLPSQTNNCGITMNTECYSIKHPDDCHTNDSTLKTWDPDRETIRMTRVRC
ncbi:MAG: hypothetical protein AAF617_15315 [Bacteroidota bacterium]